ncbi:oligosaccharide flippase family protein [Chitinophagaceae bacterium MMS25-I14]
MRRLFVKNILFVLAVNLLIKPVWIFLIDRTVQNRVGHASYGTYQTLFNLGIIFQIVLDFGLNYYNSRVISEKPERLREMFSVMLSARIVLTIFYAAIVWCTGWLLGYRGWEMGLLTGILLIQGFNVMVQYMRSNVAALHHFRIDGILSIADRFLMILICGFLLYYPATAGHFKIEWFVICQAGCYAIVLLASYFVLRKLAAHPLPFRFHTEGVFHIIKESFPYALLIFLMSVYMRSDMVLVERIAGKDEAGIYAAAYRLLDVGNIFGLMFANMLLPVFGRMLGQKEDIFPIVRVCVNMLLPASVIAAIAAAFFGTDIMELLYKGAGTYDGRVFAWLIASLPAYCLMYVYSTLLTANGCLKILNWLAVAGVAINLGFNFILIPHYGCLGAAVITFVTQTVLAGGFIFFAKKKNNLPYNPGWLLKQAGFLLVAIAVCYCIQMLPVSWLLQLTCYAVVSVGLMFVFGFISVPEMVKLFKKEN